MLSLLFTLLNQVYFIFFIFAKKVCFHLGLGFNITGGTDTPHLPNDDGIFVTKIREAASASVDGRLKEGDKILKVNCFTNTFMFVVLNVKFFVNF